MSMKEKLSFRKTSHAKSKDDGQGWQPTDINDTLNIYDNAETRTPTLVVQKVYENHSQDTRYRDMGEICQPISATFGMGGNNQPFVVKQVFDASRRHDYEQFKDDVCETVQAHYGTGGGNVPLVMENNIQGFDNYNISLTGNVAKTLQSQGGGTGVNEGCVYVKSVDTSHADDVARVDDVVPCMQGRQSQGGNNVMADSIVRRLTPLECERLQGYPDGWTDIGEWIDTKGKKHKDADSPRYKALGNSIALPFWEWMAHRMVAQYDRPTTMASLFDGIGGFPLVFSRCGTTPVWASEIEEFPIAVTKRRFPDTEDESSYEHETHK